MTLAYTELMYQTQKDLLGEPFTASVGGNVAQLTGVYDDRIFVGSIDGTDARTRDTRIGVPAKDLVPYPWIAPGVDITIRGGSSLRLTHMEPDGQGLMYLVCRPA